VVRRFALKIAGAPTPEEVMFYTMRRSRYRANERGGEVFAKVFWAARAKQHATAWHAKTCGI
jgi:hypothetical protein